MKEYNLSNPVLDLFIICMFLGSHFMSWTLIECLFLLWIMITSYFCFNHIDKMFKKRTRKIKKYIQIIFLLELFLIQHFFNIFREYDDIVYLCFYEMSILFTYISFMGALFIKQKRGDNI